MLKMIRDGPGLEQEPGAFSAYPMWVGAEAHELRPFAVGSRTARTRTSTIWAIGIIGGVFTLCAKMPPKSLVLTLFLITNSKPTEKLADSLKCEFTVLSLLPSTKKQPNYQMFISLGLTLPFFSNT